MQKLLVTLLVSCVAALTATSASAAAPANDNFSAAQPITGALPQRVTGTNVDATEETGEPDHANRDGKHSVWYSWTASSSGRVAVGTCAAAEFDTTIGVYTGNAVNALALTESNDDACTANRSSAVFEAVAGTAYKIAVDGYDPPASGTFTLKIQASSPLGGDSLLWTNYSTDGISYSNLDGGGSGQIDTTGATLSGPYGMAIDAAKGKVWWVNYDANGISSANLGGGGGSALNTPGATLDDVNGLALDPATATLYWANGGNDTIGYARTDGSGGGTLNTGAATVDSPCGVTVDPASNRIYWANYGLGPDSSISAANLDGSGGGTDLNITGDTPFYACGVAVDSAADRLWWSNIDNDIASTGTGGGAGTYIDTDSNTDPYYGLALDPTAGKVWFADYASDSVASADTAGTGAIDLDVGTAVVSNPAFPTIIRKPAGAAAPAASASGSTLSCTQGSWAADLVSAFLYRAPQSFTYAWTRDGQPVAAASGQTLTATESGSYACAVTATNAAGSATQTSAAVPVEVSSASNKFKLGKVKLNKKKGTATLAVTVPGPGKLSLAGKGVKTAKATTKKQGTVSLPIKASGKSKGKLKAKGKLKVKVAVTFAAEPGDSQTSTAKVKLQLKR